MSRSSFHSHLPFSSKSYYFASAMYLWTLSVRLSADQSLFPYYFASALYLWTLSVRLYADQSLFPSPFLVWIEERVLNVFSWNRLLWSRGSCLRNLCFWWSLLLFWLSSSRRGRVKVGNLHFETLRHLWGGICPFNAIPLTPFRRPSYLPEM